MRVFGYELGVEDGPLLKLSEATLQVSPEELSAVISFLKEAKARMEEHGPAFNHEHYCFYCSKQGIAWDLPDIVVAAPWSV